MNLTSLKSMKNGDKKITMLTCYDASFAKILESINVDALLVGDSLGMFIKGDINTHNVSLNDMIYHTRAVARGAKSTFIISDLPIHTYENNHLAYESALALIKVGASMVKLEGGASIAPVVQHLKAKDINVCGHIGFMPQFTQGMNHTQIEDAMKKALETITEDASELERSGVDMLVLSSIPESIAKKITQTISIPSIGFHSGKACDGEVFILYDLLMNSDTSHDLYLNDSLQANKSINVKDLLLKSIKNHS